MATTTEALTGTMATAARTSQHLLSNRQYMSSGRSFNSSPSSSSLQGRASLVTSPFLSTTFSLRKNHETIRKSSSLSCRSVRSSLVGQDPDWEDDDYIVLGLAHCFEQEEGGKLEDVFLVEPVAASSLECMENGGATCYKHVTATNLGTALKYDVSLLPAEFSSARFCNDFDFRVKCASRTWKRPHAVNHLKQLAPVGSVRSDFNFSLTDKRVINKVNVVTDEDNIKQDLSIDVYGRSKDEVQEEASSQIASLYNA